MSAIKYPSTLSSQNVGQPMKGKSTYSLQGHKIRHLLHPLYQRRSIVLFETVGSRERHFPAQPGFDLVEVWLIFGS